MSYDSRRARSSQYSRVAHPEAAGLGRTHIKRRFDAAKTPLMLLLAPAACAPHDPRADAVSKIGGDPNRGQVLYRNNDCKQCNESQRLITQAIDWYRPVGTLSTVMDGIGGIQMKAYPQFNDRQLADLYAYMRTFKK
jgi:hypothetical protein